MNKLVKVDAIKNMIFELRGQKVMLDSDLAQLYGVETRYLNKQVHRNIERFPSDFMFQLNEYELSNLKFQFGTSSSAFQLPSLQTVPVPGRNPRRLPPARGLRSLHCLSPRRKPRRAK